MNISNIERYIMLDFFIFMKRILLPVYVNLFRCKSTIKMVHPTFGVIGHLTCLYRSNRFIL